ncbi:MAG: hypothetical protein D6683_01380 [Actinomyces sp.]|nr:MAG: hypothetical protein D6683_01380 [Actinomyces sp.]
MRVKMLVEVSGYHEGGRWPPVGGETEVGDVVGAKLVANGYAVEVEAPKPKPRPRKATAKTSED